MIIDIIFECAYHCALLFACLEICGRHANLAVLSLTQVVYNANHQQLVLAHAQLVRVE